MIQAIIVLFIAVDIMISLLVEPSNHMEKIVSLAII
jgi:hypothetical protein